MVQKVRIQRSPNVLTGFGELHLLIYNQYIEEPSWFSVGQCFECLLMHAYIFIRPHPYLKEIICSLVQRGQYRKDRSQTLVQYVVVLVLSVNMKSRSQVISAFLRHAICTLFEEVITRHFALTS